MSAGVWTQRKWMDPVTENPAVGATEVWEIYNTTADAHPMHIHEIAFEVVNREGLVLNAEGEVAEPIQLDGNITAPEAWEPASRTRSSPIQGKSRESRRSSPAPASSSGTATSSNTRTTR